LARGDECRRGDRGRAPARVADRGGEVAIAKGALLATLAGLYRPRRRRAGLLLSLGERGAQQREKGGGAELHGP
jgi:hypothetical protein